MKKIILIMLTVSMFTYFFSPCIYATENEKIHNDFGTMFFKETSNEESISYPTGMLPDDDELIHLKWDNICDFISPKIWGDLNSDDKVTALDARICLRAAAKLEELTIPQMLAANVFGSNKITSMNARKILRVASKIDIFDCYELTLSLGDGIIIDTPVSDNSSYQWIPYVSVTNGFGNVQDIAGEENEHGLIVEKDENISSNYTAILTNTLGTYTVLFRLENQEFDVKDSFAIQINVCVDSYIRLDIGENYRLPAIWDTSGIPSEWIYKVNPEEGLDVQANIHSFTEFATDDTGELLFGLVPVVYNYVFIPQKKGVYHIEMIYKHTFSKTYIEKIDFTIEVI